MSKDILFRISRIKKQSLQLALIFTIISIALVVPLSFAGNIPSAMAVVPITDFNGDGYADLAIGVPGESINGHPTAGSTNIIYGSASGLSATVVPDQRFFQDSAGISDLSEDGDFFGNALATGDFNNDGYSDLAVGARGESVGAAGGAGAVNVIYGSASGLSATAAVADQFWTQDSPNIEDTAEVIDGFGSTLTTGDFNNDGYSDLAVGSAEGIGSAIGAGAVNVIYGSASGLSATVIPDQFWTQDSPNIEDTTEAVDFYGGSLATADFNNDGYSDLAVGVSSEDLSPDFSVADGGAVNVIYGSASGLSATVIPDQFWTQDSPNIEDTAEFGDFLGEALATDDFNNDGYSDLAVGISGEDKELGEGSSLIGAGAVNVIYGSASGLSATAAVADQFWTQDLIQTFIVSGPHGTLIDQSEELDFFGSQLTSNDFNNDGYDDLAISALGEDLAEGVPDAGAVNVIYGSASGLSESVLEHQFWTQNTMSVEGTSELNDGFGGGSSNESGAASGDFNNDGYSDLAVGVINEGFGDSNDNTIYAGAVNVIYGSASGLSATVIPDQLWQQNSPSIEDTIEEGDGFGSSLA